MSDTLLNTLDPARAIRSRLGRPSILAGNGPAGPSCCSSELGRLCFFFFFFF